MPLAQPPLTQSLTSAVRSTQSLSTLTPMTSLTVPLTASQHQNLQAARQTLLTSDKPHLLKIISYLRISCSVLRAYSHSSPIDAPPLPGTTFSSLMKSLYEYHPEWWKHCQVTIAGRLISDDTVIHQLLQPIDAFHQLQNYIRGGEV